VTQGTAFLLFPENLQNVTVVTEFLAGSGRLKEGDTTMKRIELAQQQFLVQRELAHHPLKVKDLDHGRGQVIEAQVVLEQA
jgi:hypothetical protein